jgi:hypothetical protein
MREEEEEDEWIEGERTNLCDRMAGRKGEEEEATGNGGRIDDRQTVLLSKGARKIIPKFNLLGTCVLHIECINWFVAM